MDCVRFLAFLKIKEFLSNRLLPKINAKELAKMIGPVMLLSGIQTKKKEQDVLISPTNIKKLNSLMLLTPK